jgi:preprotein translocase subunit YajC
VKNFAFPLLLFILVYVVLIVPQGRRRKQAAALRREVDVGAHVMLTSGLFGTVIEIDDDAVVIEAAEGIHLRYAKAAVLRVVPDPLDEIVGGHDSDDTEDADDDSPDAHHDGDTHQADGADIAAPDHADGTIHRDTSGNDVVARPANRFWRSNRPARSDPTGNDAGSGPVPTS